MKRPSLSPHTSCRRIIHSFKLPCVEFFPFPFFLSTSQLRFRLHGSCPSQGCRVPAVFPSPAATRPPPPLLLSKAPLASPAGVARLTCMRLCWKSRLAWRGYCSSKITCNNNKKSYRACLVGPARAFVRD